MPNILVFDFLDYKAYLKARIQSRPGRGRGEKARIAQHLRCHSAYISQVLGGSANFSLEQTQDLNTYLGHSSEESHFFLLLVQLTRSGSKELEKYFNDQIHQILEKRLSLKNRLGVKHSLTRENQLVYYSSWHFAAIHMAVMIASCKTREAIARLLRLPLQKVTDALDFLVEVGLLRNMDGQYQIGTTHLHLSEDSLMIQKHHTNWRLQSIRALDRAAADELHYSSLVAASSKDLPKIRSILVKAIEEIRTIVKDSKEEDLLCYTLDLFRLTEPEPGERRNN